MDLEAWGYAIGISDIKDFRECPQRFAHGMRRHIVLPERLQITPGERDEPPSAVNWTNSYGSAIHHAIHLVDKEGASHADAIDACMQEYGTYLEPGDVQMLGEDLAIFERRRALGVTLVASEAEMRVPLFITDEGQQIYFRFKLDALYRMISNPSIFLHRDYKSSKHRKSPAEVHSDIQMWAYNWGIHDLYPECSHLHQTYDQLRFGEEDTTKNDAQREQVKQWLIANVKIILRETAFKPKTNDFCRYCDLVVTCREPRRETRYWRGRLAVLAPLTIEGRKVKVAFAEEGDELEEMIADELKPMIQVRKHIEHVEKELKGVISDMPEAERERLGWALKDRRTKTLPPDGLRALHELLGDSFYQLASLSVTKLEELVGKPKKGEPVPPELQLARDWLLEEVSGANVVAANSD